MSSSTVKPPISNLQYYTVSLKDLRDDLKTDIIDRDYDPVTATSILDKADTLLKHCYYLEGALNLTVSCSWSSL